MFHKPIEVFSLYGFRIRLDISWFLIAGFLVWTLSSGFFPELVPDLGRMEYVALAFAAMLGLFACLILHELAHSLTARRFGLGVGSITLFLFGGVAELEEEPASARSELWIALAGPAMSFALAALFAVLPAAFALNEADSVMGAFLGYLAMVNLFLGLFNLLPAFPLDGGRVLRALLWSGFDDVIRATRIASRVSSALALFLIALGLYSILFSGQPGGLWLILIGVFLLSTAQATYQRLLMRARLKGRSVRSVMTANPVSISPDATLAKMVDGVMLGQAASFVPVVEDGVVLGFIDQHVLNRIDRENWETTCVGDVFVALDDENAVDPDDPVETLMQRMAQSGRRKFLVIKNRELAGVVTLTDILSYLSVLRTLEPDGSPNHHSHA